MVARNIIKDSKGKFISKYEKWSLDNFEEGYIDSSGRFIVVKPGHPRADSAGQIKRSIVAYEAYYNESVPIGYVVHHKDLNGLNDSKDNLIRMKNGEHTRFHWLGKSRKGQNDYLKTGKNLRCPTCGNSFYRAKWELKLVNYCSKPCWYHRNKKEK